jgi:phosphatidylglycerophosphate synthase
MKSTGNSVPGMPPFADVLKSRDVEDPVNLWLHRPLAYAFCAVVYRTSMTPNQVTLIAIFLGLAAAACWFDGSPPAMLSGGILLWSSAIMDGADGILARAKRMFSDLGRALDGSADLVVGVATILAASYHLWQKHHSPALLVLVPLAIGGSILHIYLYDYYKESFLMMTRRDWNGVAESIQDVEGRYRKLKEERAHPWHVWATKLYVDLIVGQTNVVRRTNPKGARQNLRFTVTERSITEYRRYNLGPLRVWTAISLAPHTYLMAISSMFDRIDLYLWFRVVGANALFVLALLWQRHASARTLEALEAAGTPPVPLFAGQPALEHAQ